MISDSVVEPEAARVAVGFALVCLAVLVVIGFVQGDLHWPSLYEVWRFLLDIE